MHLLYIWALQIYSQSAKEFEYICSLNEKECTLEIRFLLSHGRQTLINDSQEKEEKSSYVVVEGRHDPRC